MLVLLFLLTFSLATPEPNVRCIVPGPPAAELAQSSAVFSGKVVGRKYVEDSFPSFDVTGQRLVVVLKVERVWKGEIGEEVEMYMWEVRLTNGLTWSISEDFLFEDDKQYLVYAHGKLEKLSTSGCSRSRELVKAEDDLKELGEGHKPKLRSIRVF